MSPSSPKLVVLSFVIGLTLGASGVALPPNQGTERSHQEILESYVEDFRFDQFASEPMLFGVQIPDAGDWHVRATGQQEDGEWDVELVAGPPPTPTFYYRVEDETLRAIDRGDINALTAQGKSFQDDYAPMDVLTMDGYEPNETQDAAINPYSFHFWTRGFPEVVPFGEGMTRRAHGSNFVVFYYQKGLRTAWYRVEPEDRVRDDPREMPMPFPTLVIGIRGTAEGIVGGERVTMRSGEAVFIPPNTEHRWWNETEDVAEAVVVMFGDGA